MRQSNVNDQQIGIIFIDDVVLVHPLPGVAFIDIFT